MNRALISPDFLTGLLLCLALGLTLAAYPGGM